MRWNRGVQQLCDERAEVRVQDKVSCARARGLSRIVGERFGMQVENTATVTAYCRRSVEVDVYVE